MTLFPEPAAGPTAALEIRRVSLVRLCALIAQAVSGVGKVSVEGEVHRVQRGKTGRLWFTLRDRASQITVSVPRARVARSRAVNGERVCVVGRIEWVNDWGQLQLVADEITPVGEGAIAAAIAEARRRLAADGLIDRPRQTIPRLPTLIGVVCGHEAAVRADIESVVAARFPGYPVLFAETTVSGPGAVDNIVGTIGELCRRGDVDVIVLARGGGDATQLLPFSDEALCRAVAAASVPVVAAIGHDGDRPLVDEVADLRCGTPSLAAAAVVPDESSLTAGLAHLLAAASAIVMTRAQDAGERLGRIDRGRAALACAERATARFAAVEARRALVHPRRRVDAAAASLQRIEWAPVAGRQVAAAGARLAAASTHVEALSPVRVLERGYAVLRTADGVVVRRPEQVRAGDAVRVEVAAGFVAATVDGTGRR